MYSNKENINILTALLVSHGIKDAVVCPGSRNAPIIHNLDECPKIKCHPVTDERSAAFVALGIAQATHNPVVVCVTSGTALLNTAPAVAEATYQHQGIIVISADRPAAWIGQGAGQTIPQPGALGEFVEKCVNIHEPHTDEDRWHINRLVNEALIATKQSHRPSVHINVPLGEPLFEYTVKKLPKERTIEYYRREICNSEYFVDDFCDAKRPMIVVGSMDEQTASDTLDALEELSAKAVVINEVLSGNDERCSIDLLLKAIGDNDRKYIPDLVLHVGGEIVSARLKTFVGKAKKLWRISPNGEIIDTYQNLTGVLDGDTKNILGLIATSYLMRDFKTPYSVQTYLNLWEQMLNKVDNFVVNYEPAYSQAAAVKTFEQQFYHKDYAPHIHYANSCAIRLANLFARHQVWCNRGINGIDGSVSTAVGFAMATNKKEAVVLVTGDLSFFYDSNALWNTELPQNLSILLLNNGEGGIFNQVRGFGDNPLARGKHHATAEGICLQNGVGYVPIHNMEELESNISRLGTEGSPIVLEVFTDAAIDKEEISKIYHTFKL